MNESANDVTRTDRSIGRETAVIGRIAAILGAGLLGLFIVLSVGFAPMAAVHNAVHDVRHSASFPCH